MRYFASLISALALVFFVSCARSSQQEVAEPVEEASDTLSNALGFCPDSLDVKEGKVKSGQFFSNLLGSLGMTQKEANDLTHACDSVFDVRTLRVDNAYRAYYGSDASVKYLVYDRDRASSIVFDCTPPYGAWVYEKPVSVESRYADVTINSSLWNDMRDAGVSPLLILSLSDIYAWTIDFFGLL